MHDIDLLDPPPTDLETAAVESSDPPAAASPGAPDTDALLALLRLLGEVGEDRDGGLVVWCADPLARDAASAARAAGRATPFAFEAISTGADTGDEPWFGDAERAACPGPSATQDRERRQRRRSRR